MGNNNVSTRLVEFEPYFINVMNGDNSSLNYLINCDEKYQMDDAKAYLMVIYCGGYGVTRDVSRARSMGKEIVDWLFRLNEDAMNDKKEKSIIWYLKGFVYDYGLGVEQNDGKAFKYFELSADQGNSYGQYNVGNCYHVGIGVKNNNDKAFKYWKLSADQGDSRAKINLDYLLSSYTPSPSTQSNVSHQHQHQHQHQYHSFHSQPNRFLQ